MIDRERLCIRVFLCIVEKVVIESLELKKKEFEKKFESDAKRIE